MRFLGSDSDRTISQRLIRCRGHPAAPCGPSTVRGKGRFPAWNCGTCATSSQSRRSATSGERPSGCTSRSRRCRSRHPTARSPNTACGCSPFHAEGPAYACRCQLSRTRTKHSGRRQRRQRKCRSVADGSHRAGGHRLHRLGDLRAAAQPESQAASAVNGKRAGPARRAADPSQVDGLIEGGLMSGSCALFGVPRSKCSR